MGADPVMKVLVSVMQSPPAPLSRMDGVQLQQTARAQDTQKTPQRL